jgi:hypothetical protein
MIVGCKQRTILAGRMGLLYLRRTRRRMRLVHVRLLLGRGPDLNPSLTTVEGHV